MKAEDRPRGYVLPLGIFGVMAGQPAVKRIRQELVALEGSIEIAERRAIANYLRRGAIVFAVMEYTRDVLHDAVGVSGGSAVLTDGSYYWRRDAAEYVERYGIAVPDTFIQRGRLIGWTPAALTREEVIEIDDYLMEHIRRLQG